MEILQILLTMLTTAWLNGVHSAIILACEGEMARLSCNLDNVLILAARYGREAGSVLKCGENLNLTQGCVTEVTQQIRPQCNGKGSCEIRVDSAVLGPDLCPDALKYLEVDYECQSHSTYMQTSRCIQKCMQAPVYNTPNRYTANVQSALSSNQAGPIQETNSYQPNRPAQPYNQRMPPYSPPMPGLPPRPPNFGSPPYQPPPFPVNQFPSGSAPHPQPARTYPALPGQTYPSQGYSGYGGYFQPPPPGFSPARYQPQPPPQPPPPPPLRPAPTNPNLDSSSLLSLPYGPDSLAQNLQSQNQGRTPPVQRGPHPRIRPFVLSESPQPNTGSSSSNRGHSAPKEPAAEQPQSPSAGGAQESPTPGGAQESPPTAEKKPGVSLSSIQARMARIMTLLRNRASEATTAPSV